MKVQLSNQVSLSRIALGFWRFMESNVTRKEFEKFIEEVLDIGISTMDHADSYGRYKAEKRFGDFLEHRKDLKNKMEFVTKVGLVYPSSTARVKYYNNSKEYILKQVDQSLSNLKINEIDVLLLHRPDWYQNPYEVAEAFDELNKLGKVKSFGVSNYLPHQFKKLESFLDFPLITNQVELSVLNYENFENGTLDLCMERKIHPMIWSPLAGGKIFTENDKRSIKLRETLEIIREEINAETIDEVSYAWILSHPLEMIPITGSYDIELVKRPVSALKYKLTPEQWYMIWTVVKGHKVP